MTRQQAISRPMRKDAVRNRERLMEAANALIAFRGLDVSLDEVARHAGVGLSTAYRHFPDRRELLQALCERRMAAVAERSGHAATMADPAEALRWLLGQVGELQQHDRAVWELLRSNLGISGLRAGWTALLPIVDDLLARGKAEGSMRADLDSTDIPAIIWMLGTITDHAGTIRPDLWRRYLDMMLVGITAVGPHGPSPTIQALDAAELDAVMGAVRPDSQTASIDFS